MNKDSAETPLTSLCNIAQCSQCGQMEYQLQVKLKRCGGCSVARYCSKACQKNAWPTHKIFCRTTGQGVPNAFAGYPCAMTRAHSIKFWVEIHDYSFTILTAATALLTTNFDPKALREPRAFKFELDLGIRNQGPGGHPARAFQLLHISFISGTEVLRQDLTEASSWDTSVACCHEIAEEKRKADPAHIIDGVVPAVFVMMNTGLVTWHQFPIYAPRQHPALLRSDPVRSVMEDAMAMCLGAMNTGVIFRYSGTPQSEPMVGDVVKQRKKWVWRDKDAKSYWERLAQGLAPGSPKKSGLSPLDIWTSFHRL